MAKRRLVVPLLAAVFAILFAAAPTASALPLADASAMWVTTENPSSDQLGLQVAAISNPYNSDADRWANVYGANGPNRPLLELYFQYIKAVQPGDIEYSLGEVRRNGDNITMRIKSSARGYGTFDEDHYWVREDGRWKYDVVQWCKMSPSCPGKDMLR